MWNNAYFKLASFSHATKYVSIHHVVPQKSIQFYTSTKNKKSIKWTTEIWGNISMGTSMIDCWIKKYVKGKLSPSLLIPMRTTSFKNLKKQEVWDLYWEKGHGYTSYPKNNGNRVILVKKKEKKKEEKRGRWRKAMVISLSSASLHGTIQRRRRSGYLQKRIWIWEVVEVMTQDN